MTALLQIGGAPQRSEAATKASAPVVAAALCSRAERNYRGTPYFKPLQKEVLRALKKARFVPAMANGKPTPVFFGWHCALLYQLQAASSRPGESGSDSPGSFRRFYRCAIDRGHLKRDSEDPRIQAAARRNKNGAVTLELQVSETGTLLSSKVLSEDPSGYNFGAVELQAL